MVRYEYITLTIIQRKISECFATENGTQTFNKSAQTIKFTELFEEYINCANTTESKDVCSICMDKYVTLNKYFLSISNENEKIGVCMDIVDLVSKYFELVFIFNGWIMLTFYNYFIKFL